MTDTAPQPGHIRRSLRSQRVIPPLCLAIALGSAAWLGHDFGYDSGYGAGRHQAAPAGVDVSSLPAYVDRDMAAQAAADGEPFLYQLRDGPVPCWPRLRMPDGRSYPMEDAETADTGVAPPAGRIPQYGCELPEVAAQLPPR